MSSPTRSPPLPIPRSPRYAALDFWRGLACLFVVVLHSAHYVYEALPTIDPVGKVILLIISKMGVGVPMFFVISGYCIAATCDSARRKQYSPGSYFYRRFRRILPGRP
jgi:peptidoglycan/LPS O-acetylase OafA/YrhL